MSSFRIRPSFCHVVGLDPKAAYAQIVRTVTRQFPDLEVKTFPDFIGLHVPARDRRYWSPRLFLNFQALPEGGTRIEGTYGPEMEVWAVFLYGYLLSGLIGTFTAILGGAQVVTGERPWAFWITGTAAGVAVVFYLAAQLGQKLGARQTFRLHQACETALGQPVEIA